MFTYKSNLPQMVEYRLHMRANEASLLKKASECYHDGRTSF